MIDWHSGQDLHGARPSSAIPAPWLPTLLLVSAPGPELSREQLFIIVPLQLHPGASLVYNCLLRTLFLEVACLLLFVRFRGLGLVSVSPIFHHRWNWIYFAHLN